MVSVLERELTCSICTDILFDPVTFIKCQHTNCGACAKSWFRQNETCPVCRQQVVDTGINSTIRNLLEDFLLHHPDKKRTATEIIDARNIYKPGDKVLGALTTSTNELFTDRAPAMPQRPLTLPTPNFPGWNFPQPQGPTGLTGDSGLEEATAHFNLLSGITNTNTQRTLSSLSAGTPLSSHYLPESTFFRSHSLSVPGSPRNLVELLTRTSNGLIQVNCDSCRTSVQEDIHYECTSCEMFHVCLRCHRHGRSCAESGHILLPQRLVHETSTTIQHLQTGIFCAICNGWCDEDRRDRPQAAKSFFWHCEICNNGHWTYCQSCVRRGNCCSHPLTLWTNNRSPSGAYDGLLFRGPKHATVAAYPRTMNRGRQWLQARQYMRWTGYNLDCDVCHELIHIRDLEWWHCHVCNNAGWDVCSRCYTRNHGVCSAMGRHRMSRMRFVASEGSGALKIEAGLPIERSDLVDATAEAKVAVALRGVWEGEDEGGGMQWGLSGGHLWFPDGATIGDVLRIFEDDGVAWYWGTYAGVGGIFDGRAVEIQ